MKIFDSTLKTLERSLDVRLARHNVLAGNLANVDTPGYKPKDVDFAAAMSNASMEGGRAIAVTSPGHIAMGGVAGAGGIGDTPLLETEGESATLDGNRVDLDRTMASLAENGMQYGASARAASKKLAILRYAAGDGQG